MTFCDSVQKQKSSSPEDFKSVCVHVVTPVWVCVCVCVCVIRLESFDVNKLCHCFVRPLSPKQHIISLLQGLFLFLSVSLASLYE